MPLFSGLLRDIAAGDRSLSLFRFSLLFVRVFVFGAGESEGKGEYKSDTAGVKPALSKERK